MHTNIHSPKNLKRVSFQEGSRLEKIGQNCFSGTAIEEFLAPSSLRKIGDIAFAFCGSLERVVLNEGLERLGAREVIEGKEREGQVFRETGIGSIRLPSTLRRVEAQTFWGCYNLKTIEIQNGVEYIGKESFYWCVLESVVFPASVKMIDKRAIYGNKLRDIAFDGGSGLRIIGDCALGAN